MAAANINSPMTVVAVYQDVSGKWRMAGSTAVIAAPVSVANINAPLGCQLFFQDSTGAWNISASRLVK